MKCLGVCLCPSRSSAGWEQFVVKMARLSALLDCQQHNYNKEDLVVLSLAMRVPGTTRVEDVAA